MPGGQQFLGPPSVGHGQLVLPPGRPVVSELLCFKQTPNLCPIWLLEQMLSVRGEGSSILQWEDGSASPAPLRPLHVC
jgi:hypothetical protein